MRDAITPDDITLAAEWLRIVERPQVAAALEEVYADVARAVAEQAPACWASGRCCNFAKNGHLLYVTGLEAAFTVSRLSSHRSEPLQPDEVRAACESGGCPFQIGNLCGVHPIRPLGCRLYFCDRTAQEWQHELYEREMELVRRVHDRFGVTYRYAEWRRLLQALARARKQES